jgi:hypothetical protein
MKSIFIYLLLLVTSASFAQQAPPATPVYDATHSPEINTMLMETTFLILGPSSHPGEEAKSRCGTGFVIMRLAEPDSSRGQWVLVTAKHVFEDIRGDTATMNLRSRNAAGDITAVPYSINIRDKGKVLYTEHPTADVAAIDIPFQTNTILAQLGSGHPTPNWFASEQFLHDIEIHPGDELLTLGYPLCAAANDSGYPILRSGKIASYPILPIRKAGKILFDFRVLPGNSGGPVYFSYQERTYKQQLQLGMSYQKLFGLVTQQAGPINDVDPSIGAIVPAIYIKETIDKLAGFEFKAHD